MMRELYAADQDRDMIQKAMVMIKYEGYIQKQKEDIEKIKRMEDQHLPENLDYETIPGLRKESREKFMHFKPRTIYDAKHISGINPADIYVLLNYIQKKRVIYT
jgi:tRNA uridine 5-carboxymethylaminomethyl modification enzyme